YNLQALYQTPTLPEHLDGTAGFNKATQIIAAAREAGRTLLTEAESKELLAAYGIPTTEMQVAEEAEEAIAHAEEMGYPVVLKLHSYTVTHKTDVGGVKLNLRTEKAVRQAFDEIKAGVEAKHSDGFDGVSVQPMVRLDGYELIIGSSLDVQFGPVLLFGSGGSLVEVYKDRALGLPPLTTTLARRMMEQTTIYEALQGVRGRDPVDLEALEELMVRFSQLVVEQRFIKEIDINPLLASPERLLVLDARVVLYDPDVEPGDLQKLAIRPYPRRYVGTHTLRDGTSVTIRPIRPEDEPLVVDFHKTLSERSVYLRYAGQIDYSKRVAHSRLARLSFIDYDREMALVAEQQDPETGPKIIGIGRLTTLPGTKDAEFALLVPDEIQGQGLGTELLRRLVQVGQDFGLDRIMADILTQNGPMQRVARKLGFHIVRTEDLDDGMVKAVNVLEQ
ncbi:MAG TPA: GNAT family N-acetyltransferase, partial [Rhodothermales bacterium]|nr:GNAT family N-acetyltransferase [Rhodothermales bacterium]